MCTIGQVPAKIHRIKLSEDERRELKTIRDQKRGKASQALRAAALLMAEPMELPAISPRPSPCDSCASRPCLTTCPVGAIRTDGFHVADCRALLRTLSGQSCVALGCIARRSCPVGRAHAYDAAQAAFHMRAFRDG